MPEIVLRHSDKSVLPYVLSIPFGVDEKEVEAAHPGWSLDKKTSPLDARAEHDEGVAKAWKKFTDEHNGETPVAVASVATVKEK